MATPEIETIYCQDDLPADHGLSGLIALDCEMMGLNFVRDRLCALQLFAENSNRVYVVHFTSPRYDCPEVKAVLSNANNIFLGHMIRLDLQFIAYHLKIMPAEVWCTRTASRIARTYGASHDLANQLSALLGVKLNKSQTNTNWGAPELTSEQLAYAANDVIYLPALKEKLSELLQREHRQESAQTAMAMIPLRAALDINGWPDEDLLSFPF